MKFYRKKGPEVEPNKKRSATGEMLHLVVTWTLLTVVILAILAVATIKALDLRDTADARSFVYVFSAFAATALALLGALLGRHKRKKK